MTTFGRLRFAPVSLPLLPPRPLNRLRAWRWR